MTVKELASKMNELCRAGMGDVSVYFTEDRKMSHPIRQVYEDKITSLDMLVVILDSDESIKV